MPANEPLNFDQPNNKLSQIYEIFKLPHKIPQKSYNLDQDRIKNYYKMLIPEIVPIVKKVIDNTIYMSYPKYIKDLLEKIEKLKKYLDKYNIKSIKLVVYNIETTNRWVSQIIYHNLKGINIIIIDKFQGS